MFEQAPPAHDWRHLADLFITLSTDKPGDEKRMAVILPVERYDEWLQARPEQSQTFMRLFPADQMIADDTLHNAAVSHGTTFNSQQTHRIVAKP